MDTNTLISLGLFNPTKTLSKAPATPTRAKPRFRKLQPTKAVHAQRKLDLLRALHKFGHLRSHEIAMALYPKARYALQLAQRLARKLVDGGFILPRKNTLGGQSYVLADRGVAALDLAGVSAKHGRDIVGVAGATFIHRTLASQYLLHRSKGALAFGEYAIAHGQAPIDRETLVKRFGKVPDGLVCYSDDQGPVVDVLEVEQSAKPMNELLGVLKWAEVVGTTLGGPGTPKIGRLVIAYDGSQGHQRRILRAALARWGHCGETERNRVMRRVVLASVSLGQGATWHGCTEKSLASCTK